MLPLPITSYMVSPTREITVCQRCLFDRITDVINQVPKTKAAMINSLAPLLGMAGQILADRAKDRRLTNEISMT